MLKVKHGDRFVFMVGALFYAIGCEAEFFIEQKSRCVAAEAGDVDFAEFVLCKTCFQHLQDDSLAEALRPMTRFNDNIADKSLFVWSEAIKVGKANQFVVFTKNGV